MIAARKLMVAHKSTEVEVHCASLSGYAKAAAYAAKDINVVVSDCNVLAKTETSWSIVWLQAVVTPAENF